MYIFVLHWCRYYADDEHASKNHGVGFNGGMLMDMYLEWCKFWIMINDGTENDFNLCCLAQDYNVIKYPGHQPIKYQWPISYCHSISAYKIEVSGSGRLNLYIGKVQMRQISEKSSIFSVEKNRIWNNFPGKKEIMSISVISFRTIYLGPTV